MAGPGCADDRVTGAGPGQEEAQGSESLVGGGGGGGGGERVGASFFFWLEPPVFFFASGVPLQPQNTGTLKEPLPNGHVALLFLRANTKFLKRKADSIPSLKIEWGLDDSW